MAGLPIVGNLGRFVELGAYAVSHIIPDDGEAVGLHIFLDGVGDVGDPVTEAGVFHALPEGLLGDGDELRRLVADLPAGKGARAVTVKAADVGADVHADDVAFLQDLIAGDPVDDFVVHRDAGRSGEGLHPRRSGEVQEGRNRPLALDEFANCLIYFQSGYAGAYHFARQRAGRRGNLPRTAHPLDISG